MAVLKRDWMGSELADFERALLFDEDKRHWGWFKWLPDGANRVFTLAKSPFLGPVGVPEYYVLPEGFGHSPSEGQFIQVEIDGTPHDEYYPERLRSYGVRAITSVSDRQLMNILPKPRLYLDEFRQQATINFDNAEEDRLDLVLPLQLVSCPNNEAGQGGIVVRRDTFLEAGDHFDNIRLFKKGVLDQIPSGFRDVNPDYIYRIVSPVNEKSVAKLQKKVREVNMMTDPGTSVKIHLPLIHEKSVYRFRQPLSSDVVAYQLTALICQPHLRRQDIKPIEQSILKARKRMEKLSLDLNMTPVAEVKIAEAFARMRMVQNDAIYRFLGAAARLVDEQLKIVEELYEDRWAHQMEEYGSLLSLFDGVELKDVTVGKSKKLLNLSRFDASLSRRDLSAYVAIRKIMEESGVQYVNRQDLKKSLGVDDISLRESLDMLRNRGYIIMLENGSLIKVFDLGEFSGRFDEALPK